MNKSRYGFVDWHRFNGGYIVTLLSFMDIRMYLTKDNKWTSDIHKAFIHPTIRSCEATYELTFRK